MPSVTLTVTPAEATRLQAFATAAGFPDIKTLIVATMRQGLQQFEQTQNQQTYQVGYTPIQPT